MAATAVSYNINEGKCDLECEVDLSSAGVVGAIRGSAMSVTKTGTGTYSLVYAGSSGLTMYEILNRQADLVGSPTGAFWAKVTSVTQAQGTPDMPITVNITLLNNAATPVATDVTAACTLTFGMSFRVIRNPYTSPI